MHASVAAPPSGGLTPGPRAQVHGALSLGTLALAVVTTRADPRETTLSREVLEARAGGEETHRCYLCHEHRCGAAGLRRRGLR